MIRIAVSPLAVSGTEFTEAAIRVINEAADFAHIDVMDGKFVENKTFSADTVRNLKINVPKDVHLMVEKPEYVWSEFVDDNTAMVSFHIEACKKPAQLIKKIKEKGIKVGIAINPETAVSKLEKYLSELDFVLVMFIHPGAAGQAFMPAALETLKKVRKLAPDLDIEVDGGINFKTAPKVIGAGATILVSSSFIYKHEDPILAVDILRNI